MPPLAQLLDPDAYSPCDWDLKRDHAARDHWCRHFIAQLDSLIPRLRDAYPDAPADRVSTFVTEYTAQMEAILAHPERCGRVDIYTLDAARDRLLDGHGFPDPYCTLKSAETDASLQMLPGLLRKLDALPEKDRFEELARGLLAGNLFDVGAQAAMERHVDHAGDFERTKASLPARPWLSDALDELGELFRGRERYREIGLFVDNCGPDICLGVLPLVRWFLSHGRRVALVANSEPALNDVTAPELIRVLRGIDCGFDPALADAFAAGRLRVLSSGQRSPLVDLANLDSACVRSLAGASLLWLHGMGRAVESNWEARFRCDVVRTAVLKDELVAGHVGGSLFDCIFRLDPGR